MEIEEIERQTFQTTQAHKHWLASAPPWLASALQLCSLTSCCPSTLAYSSAPGHLSTLTPLSPHLERAQQTEEKPHYDLFPRALRKLKHFCYFF